MRGLNTYRYDRCRQCGVPTMRDVSDDKQVDHMMANVYTDMDPQRWRMSAMTSRWILMMTDACSLPVISAPPACRQLILTVHSQQTCWPNLTYKIRSAGVAERQRSKKEKNGVGGISTAGQWCTNSGILLTYWLQYIAREMVISQVCGTF